MLTDRGHGVIPFSLRYRQNEPTPHAEYFAPAPLGEDFFLYGDRPLGWRDRIRLARRVISDPDVYRAAARVIREQKIELVYCLQIAHYLYPEVILAAHDAGVPVIMRLSDYQMICPAYHCLRNGRPCFACRESLVPALVHRCLKKSLPITATRVLAMACARAQGVQRKIANYISPSNFLLAKMAEGGFDKTGLHHVPTPIHLPPDPGPAPADGPLLYVGGLDEAKGVRLAVEAVRGTGMRLLIAGNLNTPTGERLQAFVQSSGVDEVELLGFVQGEELENLYARARAVLVPSIWWENVPHTALEAMARRRVVVATGHGSLLEIIHHEKTGLLFAPGDPADLRKQLLRLDDPTLVDRLGSAGRDYVARVHDPKIHLDRLEKVFAEVLA